MSEEKREYASGVTSTKQPRLSLIPHRGLVNAAERFELGLQKHGDKSWNNLSKNQAALTDTDWLIERASHAIEHCYKIIDTLKTKGVTAESLADAGAVAWFGLVMGEAASQVPWDKPKTTIVANNLDKQTCAHCHLEFKSGDIVTTLMNNSTVHDYCYESISYEARSATKV